jgi:hypothetical protein
MLSTQHQTPGPTGDVQAVRGVFQSNAALAKAVRSLGEAGFDRSRLTVPITSTAGTSDPPELSGEQAKTEDDGRQLRTLRTSTVAAAAAMAGAAAVVATGGAAAAAMAMAAGAGLVAGGGMYAANNAADIVAADESGLTLVVATSNAQELSLAQQTLRDAGAQRVDVERHAADAHIVGQSEAT